jgi:ATP-dependent DNA ligase
MDAEEIAQARWIHPRVMAEISFNEWTPDKHLRHSEFKRLRDDTLLTIGKLMQGAHFSKVGLVNDC